ncbi:hypothetical protein CSAL01_04254 [Colletotrichum salicis]|uniref:Uncharacterized protein n=1 Tax=Colletotrichum salicis TaxID=1209931 RepID=A0A135TD41_9PEZI|nr:hypothetical protein CSAL01_04254 [Colletotrichum salicis]
MKAFSTLIFFVVAITQIYAVPTADAKILVSESSLRAEYHTSWVEDPTVRNPRPVTQFHELRSRSSLMYHSNHGFEREREDKETLAILAEANV